MQGKLLKNLIHINFTKINLLVRVSIMPEQNDRIIIRINNGKPLLVHCCPVLDTLCHYAILESDKENAAV